MDAFSQLSTAPAYSPFFLAAFAGWASTFLARQVAFRFSVVAKPCARRRHEAPTPLLGGLAIYLVLAVGLGALLFVGKENFKMPVSTGHALLFLGALTTIFVTGLIDDWIELRARHKLLGQLIAGIMILFAEDNLPVIFQNYGIAPWLGYPFALFWIVGITNAMNLIDGLDGLCSGVAAIAATGMFMMLEPWSVASLTVSVLAGASVGFFVHNFPPARIFLGDSGSLLLGFALSSLSLKIQFTGPLFQAVWIPILLFSLPILDTSLAILRRTRSSRSVFAGDRGHLHHRLQHLGLSPRAAMLCLLGLHAYGVIAAVCLARTLPNLGWVVLALAIPGVALFLKGLSFTEYLLTFQSARLSTLFVTDELDRIADSERLEYFLVEQVERHKMDGIPFTVIEMDCSTYLQQIVNNKSAHLVTFYISLYATLKAKLREGDLIARPHELQFAVILPGTSAADFHSAPVFESLKTELKELQESHGIYQGHKERPEGFCTYSYPRDKAKIFRALSLAPAKRYERRAA